MAASMRPSDWPPPNYVNSETRGFPGLFLITCATTAVVVIVRMYSRIHLTKSLGIDDWLLMSGFLLSIGMTFAEWKALTTWGWDRHLWDMPIDRLKFIRLSAWLVEIFFLLGNACTKISILLVYRKISSRSHSKWFIRLTWAAIAFTVVYTVALGLELVFVCRPFVSYWESYDPKYTGKHICGNEQIPIVFSAAASVLSDIYASVLPMLLVRTLNLTSRQRLSLYALFSAGLLTAGIGSARMAFLIKVTTNYQLGPNTHDITWDGWPTFALTDIEAHLAIICASLPALKALFRREMPSKISNMYPSIHANDTRQTASRNVPSPTHRPRTRTTLRAPPTPLKDSHLSNRPQHQVSVMEEYLYPYENHSLPSMASSAPLRPASAPIPAPQKYDCQCALCKSIDSYGNRRITPAI